MDSLTHLSSSFFTRLHYNCLFKGHRYSNSHQLPHIDLFSKEKCFAPIKMGYDSVALSIEITLPAATAQVNYPKFHTADAFEFFLNLDPLSTSLHPLCYHLVVFPIPITHQGATFHAQELSIIDREPINLEHILVTTTTHTSHYLFDIKLLAQAFPWRLEANYSFSFTYKLHHQGRCQEWICASMDFDLYRHPFAWPLITLGAV